MGLSFTQDEVAAEIKAGVPDDQGKVKSALYVRYAFGLVHESGAGWGPVYRSVALPATRAAVVRLGRELHDEAVHALAVHGPNGRKGCRRRNAERDAVRNARAARTAQERPPAATSRRRPQAAPARTPGQEKAVARYKELAATIAETEDTGELAALDASLDNDLALMAAMPEETAVLVNQLHDRIEAQRKHLFGGTG